MAPHIVERWLPVLGLAERPATTFDVSWIGGEQRLVAQITYATEAAEHGGVAGAMITFEDVLAFQVFDENMELSKVVDAAASSLKAEHQYGGRWPYLEVHLSEWTQRLAERDGALNAAEIRHLVITTRNMHLHVACSAASVPTYASID